MKCSLKSRLLGEISITSDTQVTPPLWRKTKERTRGDTKFASFVLPESLSYSPETTTIYCQSAIPQYKINVKVKESEVAQSCPTLCDPMDCSLPGSSAHGIFKARVLEWGVVSFSRGSSQPRDQTQVSRVVGRCFCCLSQPILYTLNTDSSLYIKLK